MKFSDKIALVTGGTGALGSVVVRNFLDEGASVAVTYMSDADGEKFRSTIQKKFPRAVAFKTNVTKAEEVEHLCKVMIERFGTIDIACNLVGGYMPKTDIVDLTEKEWDFMFDLNLKSCFLCTREVLKIMKQKKYGRVINVSAMAGLIPQAGRGAYGISKAAVSTLTMIAGEETKALRGADITVNAVAPSVILTLPNVSTASQEETINWVTPEQIAQTILFLASDSGAPVTGQTIKIYGKL